MGINHIIILTDHQALEGWYQEHVDTGSGPSGRRGRWHKTFRRFGLEVVYLPGRVTRWQMPCAARRTRLASPVMMCANNGSLADKLAVEELERLEHVEEQQGVHAVAWTSDSLNSSNNFCTICPLVTSWDAEAVAERWIFQTVTIVMSATWLRL